MMYPSAEPAPVERTWVVTAVAVLLVGFAGFTSVAPAPSHPDDSPPGERDAVDAREGARPAVDQLVSPEPAASELWPYTSRTRSTDGRTLAINLVVTGEPDAVRRTLTERSDVDWRGVDGDGDVTVAGNENATAERDATVDGPPVPWRTARGAARYTYVVPPNASSGQWVDATYQVGTGTYLGKRIHVRAYPAPLGNWTALQAHAEYWDWFRLRHTVTSVAPAAEFVGDDLGKEPYVRDVSRQHHGMGGGGSDGWFVVVEMATLALLGRIAVERHDVDRSDLLVPVAVGGVVLGVRALGLGAEALLPGASPKPFVAVLYPVLVLGPPVAVAKLARDGPPPRTAVVAAGGLALGLVLDASVVGVLDPPPQLVQHRLALVGAFALLAGGIASENRRTTVVGAVAWLAMLAAPLFGFV